MRTQFPTSLDQDEIYQYIIYLGVVGGIFVIVALFLYITVIAFYIASKKWKRFSTEAILKYHELHRRKGHIIFIIIVILVFFLVVEAVIFGLVENKRLHHNIVQIAIKPTTVLTPAAQAVRNVNHTVGRTGDSLDQSIILIERVLVSVEQIEDSIDFIYDAILEVQNQFDAIESHYIDASSTLSSTQDHLTELSTYQDEGYITNVPDTSEVQSVNDTIDESITTANEYLNSTIQTVNGVLVNVNTTIAKAVNTGTTEVSKAKVTLHKQIANLEDRLAKAIESLRKPNDTISDISHLAIKYGGIVYKILIVVFVFALVPLIFLFIGLVAKVPILYKFAFVASFACMFWLIAIGGIFAVVHTAFSQACDSREVLVINGIRKFTPDRYIVDLGHINIGPNAPDVDTKVYIELNTTTLHSLLSCVNPTNFFDVFGLETLIDSVFGQIYDSLDQLQQEQSEFFDSNTTSEYLDLNLHAQIASTTSGVTGFANATQNLVSGSYLDDFYGIQDNMVNITAQASNLAANANETVDTALTTVNNITRNVTTIAGDQYSFLYTLANITQLNPFAYPFNETAQIFQQNLQNAQTTFIEAVASQGNIIQKVSAITDAADSVLGDIEDFQEFLQNSLGLAIDVNDTIDEIQNQLDLVSVLVPQIYQNITDAINSIRNILDHVSNALREDTQCGFAGDFFVSFTDELCKTSKNNAQAMCAALLIMGISYFFVCVLGIGLLKRNDVHKLMELTEKGIQKIASVRVINRTLSMVNTLVRSTSEVFRGNSQRNMPTFQNNNNAPKGEGEPKAEGAPAEEPREIHEVNDDSYRFSKSVVKFSDVPMVAGEDPAPPPHHLTRGNSLLRISSALRNVHRRTSSLTEGVRALSQAQEIPYTELQELSHETSTDSLASTSTSLNGNSSTEQILADKNDNSKP